MDSWVGQRVYARCPKRSWITCVLEAWDPLKKVGNCKAVEDGGDMIIALKEEEIYPLRGNIANEDVDDLLLMTELHDATLLNQVKRRYMKDVIYTNIGAIVVALNPFNFKIPRYLDKVMPQYLAEGPMIQRNLPHSWAQAHNTYYELRITSSDQTILVSGESGAGKTEASKIVMKYLAQVSSIKGEAQHREAAQVVGAKINAASPALEAFGNAKTVRNDNSSRFGKFMKVKFDGNGFLVGAHITKYLLEKSRIITASEGERVYHAFYLLLRSKMADGMKLGPDRTYKSVSSGKTLNNVEFDSEKEFVEVYESMKVCGIPEAKINSLWKVVGGVLHLENVEFEPDGETNKVKASSVQFVQHATKLWQIDEATYFQELKETTMIIMNNPVKKLMNTTQAQDARSALNKTLYDSAFSWLVDMCNMNLDAEGTNWIGLLDIFGFEDFKHNSFEQLCINLTNETLQHHYNTYIFQKDIEECRAEGVDMSSVPFPDNTPCLKMIADKGGIMPLLDEECNLGSGTDAAFFSKVCSSFAKHEFFEVSRMSRTNFTVKHYAGNVSYDTTDFREKNLDTLKDSWKTLLRESKDDLICELLPAPVPPKGQRPTVSLFFRKQLQELMDLINSTNPHWIRCIKPHPAKKPLMFDGISVMNQLSSSGVLGTVKIRKAGYAVRIPIDTFIGQYKIIAKASGKPETAAGIVEACGYSKTDIQIGTKRAFLRSHIYVDIDGRKQSALVESARLCQQFARSVVAYNKTKENFLQSNEMLMKKLRGFVSKLIDNQVAEANSRRKVVVAEAEALIALKASLAPSMKAAKEAEAARRQKLLDDIRAYHDMQREDLEEEEHRYRQPFRLYLDDHYHRLQQQYLESYRDAADRRARREHREAEAELMYERRKIREDRREKELERLFTNAEKRMNPLFDREDKTLRIYHRQHRTAEANMERMKRKADAEAARQRTVQENLERQEKEAQMRAREAQMRHVKAQEKVAVKTIAYERYTRVMAEDFEWQKLEQRLLKGQQLAMDEQRRLFIQEKARKDQERREQLLKDEERIRKKKLNEIEMEQERQRKLKESRVMERKKEEGKAFDALCTFRQERAQRERARKVERSITWDNDRKERNMLLRADIKKEHIDAFKLADRVGAAPPVTMASNIQTYAKTWLPFKVVKCDVAPKMGIAQGSPFTVSWICSSTPGPGAMVSVSTGDGEFAHHRIKKACGEVVFMAPKAWFSEIEVTCNFGPDVEPKVMSLARSIL